jgi:hypothetical protein
MLSNSFPSEHSLSRLSDTYSSKEESNNIQETNTKKDNVLKIDFSFIIPSFIISSEIKCKGNNFEDLRNENMSLQSNLYSLSSTSLPVLNAASPKSDGFRRSHRHSIPGHRLSNYLKFLNELSAKGSSTVHLFSTAVISGSSSAPNLKEMPRHGECHSKYT